MRSCAIPPCISTVHCSLVRPVRDGTRMKSCAKLPVTQNCDTSLMTGADIIFRLGAAMPRGQKRTKTCLHRTSLDSDIGYTACFPKHRKSPSFAHRHHVHLQDTSVWCRLAAQRRLAPKGPGIWCGGGVVCHLAMSLTMFTRSSLPV
jgi:hypothetical protein